LFSEAGLNHISSAPDISGHLARQKAQPVDILTFELLALNKLGLSRNEKSPNKPFRNHFSRAVIVFPVEADAFVFGGL
jgi:hypothetical protein